MPTRELLSPIAGTLTLTLTLALLPPKPNPNLISRSPSQILSIPSRPTPSPLSSKPYLSTLHTLRPKPQLLRFSVHDHAGVFHETCEAVTEVLQEYGASNEDSLKIASNSAKYVEMLLDNVRELDEHSLWSSWDAGAEGRLEDLGSLGVKWKVYYMMKRKGDGGIPPFLESVGIRHSSAMLIARYLSSERLPDLIEKVKFVKEMLFASCDRKEFVGRNARRMMMHLSIFADDDLQRTLSFFEKLEAGNGRLNKLAYEEASFHYLIESFPRLLLRSTENHLKPLVGFLESIDVPKESIGIILLLYPPIMFYDIEGDIKPRMHALEKAGVEGKGLSRVLIKYPWVLSTCIRENYEDILVFFNEKKVQKSSVDQSIKSWPHLLGCSTSKMQSIVDKFEELGVNRKKLVPVITSSPQLLLKKPSEFVEVVSFIMDLGFDAITTGKILHRCPEIFAASAEKTLQKKVDFLVDFGISKNCIPRVIKKYPELLLLDINGTLLPRMKYLMDIGLSKRDLCSMLCRFSPLLGYSIEVVLKPKVEFLLSTMEKPLKEIVEYPRYFSYSLDKKIKPRFWVLKSRNITCNLKEMLGKNEEEFSEEYMGFGRMLLTALPKDG